ncbi:hypothetical protein EDM27_17165, partial [Staphylococcus aureus]
MPLMQFTLFTLFSKEKRGFAMGLAGLVIQFAPAIGPTFSGLIIDNTMPLMQFTLFTLFSKEKRGFAMGLAGLVIQFAPA